MELLKDKILKLRNEGKSYREIEKILICSRSTIAYHCNSTTRQKILNRKNKVNIHKVNRGGICESCGYNRCLRALDFHHLNPKEKNIEFSKSKQIYKTNNEQILAEVAKCALLCSNCHREVHDGCLVLENTKWLFIRKK